MGFCGQIPTLFLAPIAGVFVDRWDRHRVLVVTQVLSMLQSLALAVLALAGIITVAEVLVLQVFQGVINAFDTPARQAFVVDDDRGPGRPAQRHRAQLVDGERAAAILGPSIGGVLIAAVGEGWCFLVDAISYLAVIASLLAMRVRGQPASPGGDAGAGGAAHRASGTSPGSLRSGPCCCSSPW